MNLSVLPRIILSSTWLLAPVSITFGQLTKLPIPGVAELVSKGEAPLVSDIDLPSGVSLGPTRSAVAVDSKGNLYLGTSSARGIDVFDRAGHYLRSMAPKYDGTLSLLVRKENGSEFLYGANFAHHKAFKMTLQGQAVLVLPFPKKAGYIERDHDYKPCAIAVAPDGAIFVADNGYSRILKYDARGVYLKSFGGKGREEGQFMKCFGLTVDERSGRPLLLVSDMDNNRLQHFDLEGNFVAVVAKDLRRPTAAAIRGDYVAVAELFGRVTILDKSNQVVAHLGDNPDKMQRGCYLLPKAEAPADVFVAPHGICWDNNGDLYVVEWSIEGRVTKLAVAR